jgi:transcription elongation factor Elf1
MVEYYWKLQKYNGQTTRFRCPNCGKNRQYTRFINSKGDYAPYEYGKCNRSDKCGYFNYPSGEKTTAPAFVQKKVAIEFIDWNEYNYDLDFNSSFINSLIGHVNDERLVFETLKKYYVRTENDAMIYPFIDKDNRLTYVKKMEYKGLNRTKHIYAPYKANKGRFKQCLFGLHLVNDNTINCIVESEKTALICAMYYPNFTWLATGGANMISKISVLNSGTVFPDKGKAYNDWSDKVNSTKFSMSRMIEDSNLPDGSDLADMIIKEN